MIGNVRGNSMFCFRVEGERRGVGIDQTNVRKVLKLLEIYIGWL